MKKRRKIPHKIFNENNETEIDILENANEENPTIFLENNEEVDLNTNIESLEESEDSFKEVQNDFYSEILYSYEERYEEALVDFILENGYVLKDGKNDAEIYFKENGKYFYEKKGKTYEIDLENILNEFDVMEIKDNVYAHIFIKDGDTLLNLDSNKSFDKEIFDKDFDISEKQIGNKYLRIKNENTEEEYIVIPYLKEINKYNNFFSEDEKELYIDKNTDNIFYDKIKEGQLLNIKNEKVGSIILKLDKNKNIILNQNQKVSLDDFKTILISQNNYKNHLDDNLLEESVAFSLFKNLYLKNLNNENKINDLSEKFYYTPTTSIYFKDEKIILESSESFDEGFLSKLYLDNSFQINQINEMTGDKLIFTFENFENFLSYSPQIIQEIDNNNYKNESCVNFYEYLIKNKIKEDYINLIKNNSEQYNNLKTDMEKEEFLNNELSQNEEYTMICENLNKYPLNIYYNQIQENIDFLNYNNLKKFYALKELPLEKIEDSIEISNINKYFRDNFKQDFIEDNNLDKINVKDYNKYFNDYIREKDKRDIVLDYIKSSKQFLYESQELKKLKQLYFSFENSSDLNKKEIEMEIFSYLSEKIDIKDNEKLYDLLIEEKIKQNENNYVYYIKENCLLKIEKSDELFKYTLYYDNNKQIKSEETNINDIIKKLKEIPDKEELKNLNISIDDIYKTFINEYSNKAEIIYTTNKENFTTFITNEYTTNREKIKNVLENLNEDILEANTNNESIIIQKNNTDLFYVEKRNKNEEICKSAFLSSHELEKFLNENKELAISLLDRVQEKYEINNSGRFLKESSFNNNLNFNNNSLNIFNGYNDTEKYLEELSKGKTCLIKKVTNIGQEPEFYLLKVEDDKIYKQSISVLDNTNLSKIDRSILNDENKIKIETEVLSIAQCKDFLELYTGNDMHITFRDYDYNINNFINNNEKDIKTLSKIVKNSSLINIINKKDDMLDKIKQLVDNPENPVALFSSVNKDNDEIKLFKFTKNKQEKYVDLQVIIIPPTGEKPYALSYDKALINVDGALQTTTQNGIFKSLINELVIMDDQRDSIRNILSVDDDNVNLTYKDKIKKVSDNFDLIYNCTKMCESIKTSESLLNEGHGTLFDKLTSEPDIKSAFDKLNKNFGTLNDDELIDLTSIEKGIECYNALLNNMNQSLKFSDNVDTNKILVTSLYETSKQLDAIELAKISDTSEGLLNNIAFETRISKNTLNKKFVEENFVNKNINKNIETETEIENQPETETEKENISSFDMERA